VEEAKGDAVVEKTPRTAKLLEGLGFSGKIQKLRGQSKQGNSYLDTTIDLDDFNCCIIYAVQAKKKAAIAFQKSFTKMALIDILPPLNQRL
jgi:hypothetical protein